MKPDLHDILALAGTALIGAGLWQIYPPAAWIVVGVALVLVGVSGRPSAPAPSSDGEGPA